MITCRNIKIGYEGRAIAENLDFSVNKGNYLFVLGENGSGKSTLIKTILGLIKPLSGEIIFDETLNKSDMGYLPQQTPVQKDFPASVKEIVLSGCLGGLKKRFFYGKKEKEIAETNMKKTGIYSLSKSSYRELSGGQQQRVLLARALCAAQKVLLLDEPIAGLDPEAASHMYKTIYSLNKDEDMTIIMISHDVAGASKYASHILHVGNRNQLFFGTKEEYLKSDIGKAYMDLGRRG